MGAGVSLARALEQEVVAWDLDVLTVRQRLGGDDRRGSLDAKREALRDGTAPGCLLPAASPARSGVESQSATPGRGVTSRQ